MASGPQHGIEQELRAFARQRREAAGGSIELHPATRKLLQDEVACVVTPAPLVTEPNRPAPERVNWLAGFWLRFAFSGSGLCILILAIIYWFPKEPAPQLQLAQSSAGPAAESAPAIAAVSLPQQPDPAAASPVSDKLPALSALATSAEVSEAPASALAQPARPTSQSPPIEQESQKIELARESNATITEMKSPLAAVTVDPQPLLLAEKAAVRREVDNVLLAKNAPPAPQPIVATELLDAREPPSRGAVLTDSQADSTVTAWLLTSVDPRAKLRRNFNSPPPPGVLRSFRLEVAGKTVRLIDEDGSVYEGAFDSDSTTPSVASAPARTTSEIEVRASARVNEARKSVGSPLTFTTRGMNRTSKQEILFTGQFIGTARTDTAGPDAPASGRAGVTLSGQVRIGAGTVIPIKATGTAP